MVYEQYHWGSDIEGQNYGFGGSKMVKNRVLGGKIEGFGGGPG